MPEDFGTIEKNAGGIAEILEGASALTSEERDIIQGLESGEGISTIAAEHNFIVEERPQAVEIKQQEIGLVSQKELMDLKIDVSQRGWLKYWKKRLQPEMNILPAEIQIILGRLISREAMAGDGVLFQRYIRERLKFLRYDVLKRQRMELLRKQLKGIDEGKDIFGFEKDRRVVFFDAAKNELYTEESGARKIIGIGDLVADYAWGLKYRVNDFLPPRLKRTLQKHIAVNEARRNIESLFNREISQISHTPIGVSSLSEETLEKDFQNARGKGKAQRRGAEGGLAEVMAREALTRKSFNDPNADFIVERSNAAEDALFKYDFKVRRKKHLRGVAIEGVDLPRDDYVELKKRIGIQFTIAQHGIWFKKEQVAEAREKIKEPSQFIKKPVDDIVLVQIDFKKIGEYFKRWLAEGKPSGGPEQYFTEEEREALLEKVTQNLSSQ